MYDSQRMTGPGSSIRETATIGMKRTAKLAIAMPMITVQMKVSLIEDHRSHSGGHDRRDHDVPHRGMSSPTSASSGSASMIVAAPRPTSTWRLFSASAMKRAVNIAGIA